MYISNKLDYNFKIKKNMNKDGIHRYNFIQRNINNVLDINNKFFIFSKNLF